MNVLVTGAAGYVGRQLIDKLSELHNEGDTIVAMDIKSIQTDKRKHNVIYIEEDIRSPQIKNIIAQHQIDTVVHLAAIVTPAKNSNREFEYSVDVLGTRNVLEACISQTVGHFITTSSGAAYGYYKDNPEWISETDTLRGNPEFPYSDHKRLIEEMLYEFRKNHSELKQTIFRVGTILGETTKNQITALFERKKILVIKGYHSPFVFIWDQDLINILYRAISAKKEGIYNVAGDGALYPKDIADRLNKKLLIIPYNIIYAVLLIQKWLAINQTDPAQLIFIMFRPVLDNRKLKEDFGYIPQKTSSEVFDFFIRHNKFFKP